VSHRIAGERLEDDTKASRFQIASIQLTHPSQRPRSGFGIRKPSLMGKSIILEMSFCCGVELNRHGTPPRPHRMGRAEARLLANSINPREPRREKKGKLARERAPLLELESTPRCFPPPALLVCRIGESHVIIEAMASAIVYHTSPCRGALFDIYLA
jgi:hypothetical protein